MTKEETKNWIKSLPFRDIVLWDVKRYASEKIKSDYPIVKLGLHIQEQSQKVKLFNFPDEEFGILGVNNKIGIFDAYKEKGANINQAYKRMEKGWLAYNPYRVNVGSIGMRTEKHEHEYISPAYVVFSCKETLLPDFLFKLFKAERFNKIINDSTTGSVRQNLTIEILKTLEVPLPSIDTQQQLLEAYYRKTVIAEQKELEIKEIEKDLVYFINTELGILKNLSRKKQGLNFTKFSNLHKWGYDFVFSNSKQIGKYKYLKISEISSVNSGGTPLRARNEYYTGNIPWVKTGEVINDVIYDTEEKITELAITESSAKLFPKGSLVIAMYGQGLTRGRTAKLGIDASTNQACAVLHKINNEIILTDFLWIYLMNEYDNLRAMASGNNQPNLNLGMISSYRIQIPPMNIQRKIIEKFFEFKSIINSANEILESNKKEAIREFEQAIFKS